MSALPRLKDEDRPRAGRLGWGEERDRVEGEDEVEEGRFCFAKGGGGQQKGEGKEEGQVGTPSPLRTLPPSSAPKDIIPQSDHSEVSKK